MGSDGGWRRFKLGPVCVKIGSGATPRGGSNVYRDNGEVVLIRSQNVYNERFNRDGLVYISPEHAEQLRNVEVHSGDILLNITGDSVARCCQVADNVLPARVNQHVAIIRPDPEKLDPRYLRYHLVSPSVQGQMLSWGGSGGTRNALTKGMIESFEISAPEDIREQRAIAHILGTLDDEIELNRQMNETLEAMARALLVNIWTKGRGVLNQHLFKVTSDNYPKWFFYYWTERHLFEFQRIAAYKATTMGHIKRHHLSDAKAYVPKDKRMQLADEQISPVFELRVQNELVSQTLSMLRDTLLPKLISGELRVPDAEKFVEEAVV